MTSEYIRSLTRLRTDGRILKLREALKDRRDPVCEDEVLNYLLMTVRALAPAEILEIGTAEGLSGAAMLLEAPSARLTTIEADEDRYLKAKENFAALGLSSRARCVLGDAADVLPALDGPFGLIFLDGPKAQYVHYLPDLKRLLREGGASTAAETNICGERALRARIWAGKAARAVSGGKRRRRARRSARARSRCRRRGRGCR